MEETPTEIFIEVRDGAQYLDACRCRRVTLPDGSEGAVWRGLAYPFCAPNVIDVSGKALPPSECVSHSPGRGTEARAFAVVDGDGQGYLLVAGSVTDCECAAAQLRRASITVLRSGRYLGEPINGFQPDWFLRLVKPVGCDDLTQLIQHTLGNSYGHSIADQPLELRVRVLIAELATAREREAKLGRTIEELRAANVKEPQNEALSPMSGDEPPPPVQFALSEEAPPAFSQATLTPPEFKPALPVPRRLRSDIEDVLETFLPRIRLLRDSLDVLALEFASRRAAYRSLAEIGAQESFSSSWKRVQGADGWWERHVTNGQDNQGRIYAHLHPDGRWGVLISHKAEQPRDIEWLKHQPR